MTPDLNDLLAKTARFNREIAGIAIPPVPAMLTGERRDFAIKFLGEELTEFQDATTVADQADALVDMIYVGLGRLCEMGIVPGLAFELVHEANMNKVSGERDRNGERDTVIKPDGWEPPDWNRFLGAKPKILLLGYGRHGKDTVAEMLRDNYGFSFTSSSMFCAEKVMMPYFERQLIAEPQTAPIYSNAQECYDDRHNHRAEWYQQIEAFNTPDKASLGKAIFEEHDIYCGMRSEREFYATKNNGLYDYCIWVDASARGIPPEDKSSCTVAPWMADYILDNGGTLEDLAFSLDALMSNLGIAKVTV